MLGALSIALGGCASMYFRDARPAPEIRHEISRLPFSEYWTGIVFNGEKIGFTHLTIRKDADTGRYEIRSEASFVLRFLGIEKKIQLKSRDAIEADLTLADFAYEYYIDGSELRLSGSRQGEELCDHHFRRHAPSAAPAGRESLSSSVIALYPVLHGLDIGREHRYRVYSGETQSIREVTQRITGYEQSDLSWAMPSRSRPLWAASVSRPGSVLTAGRYSSSRCAAP
jgi:hypothetical protein